MITSCSASNPHVCLDVGPRAQDVHHARALADRVLYAWCAPAVADDAASAVGELVANAFQHATGPALLRMTLGTDVERLLVEVFDRSPALPQIERRQQAAGVGESGRGLAIVEACSRAWGWSLLHRDCKPWRKKIWFTRPLNDAPQGLGTVQPRLPTGERLPKRAELPWCKQPWAQRSPCGPPMTNM
ncbi:ATP-binding protein [Streptomyces sp. NPDC008343]|uniref:ATP-binding protein n=1 Tax=Streptomyces sp. NPDC008343 TaxID=3364828 RepID=UPI0036DFD2E2